MERPAAGPGRIRAGYRKEIGSSTKPAVQLHLGPLHKLSDKQRNIYDSG